MQARSSTKGEAAINKKTILTISVIFGLLLGGELLLPLLEEGGLLAFETIERLMDVFFEAVFDMDAYAAQKATAWTGLFLIVALLAWSGYVLRKKYLLAKEAAPQWWEDKKSDWRALSWKEKLIYIAVGAAMLGVLILFI
jgi:hypothetical protein